MGRLEEEYKAILCSDKLPSEKFWALEKRINKDKRNRGVIINMRRSHMRDDILCMLLDGVITLADLEGFSQELREDMAACVRRIERE